MDGFIRIVMEDFAKQVIAGIQDNIRNKKVSEFGAMNNTGEAANSLGYRFENGELVIFSSWKYFTVLETGRKPGKQPGSTEIGKQPPSAEIEKWVVQRGIGGDNPKSLAFLIARKIGEEGSMLYRKGGKSGVISDYINEKYIQDNLLVKLDEQFKQYIINEFVKRGTSDNIN
jgi:hypothetical protein